MSDPDAGRRALRVPLLALLPLLPLLLLTALLLAALLPLAGAEAGRQDPEWAFRGVPRVVAIGDIHGESDDLAQLLAAAGLTGKKREWQGGSAHLVLIGDLLGHGPDERGVLDMVLRLEREAARAGGRVHALLGHHEVLALFAEPRWVSAEACAAFRPEEPRDLRDAAGTLYAARRPIPKLPFEEVFPPGWFGRRTLFAPGGTYGDWLLRRPAVIVIDGTVFVHAGLSPLFTELGPAALNARIQHDLAALARARVELEALGLVDPLTTGFELLDVGERRLTVQAGTLGTERAAHARILLDAVAAAQAGPAFDPRGPAWYGGTARAPEQEERATFDAALEKAQARRAVIGHLQTPGAQVTSRFGGRLLRVCTGLPAEIFRGEPAALEITAAGTRVIAPGRPDLTAPVPEPAGPPPDAAALAAADREVEQFLRTAEIVKVEEVGSGVTKPKRLTLRQGTVQRRALFKTVDEELGGRVRVGRRTEMVFTDRYQYEVAAYRLDRLLGLRLVPPTVERVVDGAKGSVQLWVERALDEAKLQKYRLELDDTGPAARQRELMAAFDVLIYNTDRNLQNMLYTFEDGTLHLVDHSRAFRLNRGRPPALVGRNVELSPDFAAALRGLTREKLEKELVPPLSREQVKALVARRDELLAAK